jgi:hypothetical protein
MNNKKYKRIIRLFTFQRHKMADAKSVEYARDDGNRFSNFIRIGHMLNIDPRKVLMIYFLKHIDSLVDWVSKDFSEDHMTEGILGRIMDLLNYLELLVGLHIYLKKGK